MGSEMCIGGRGLDDALEVALEDASVAFSFSPVLRAFQPCLPEIHAVRRQALRKGASVVQAPIGHHHSRPASPVHPSRDELL